MTEGQGSVAAGGRPVPFFIVGCPRSGTTLAAQILDGHSRLAVYLEMTYYGTFGPIVRFYGDLARPRDRRRFVEDALELVRLQRGEPPTPSQVEEALVAPTFEGVLATLLELNARRQGKVRGGEKTPLHFKHLPEILEGFPDSPVLFLVRDPRDVAVSMRKAWGTSVQEAAAVWNEAYASLTASGGPRVHLVRYERLVGDPVATTQKMCAALGEPFEPAMVESAGRVPAQLKAIRHLDLTRLSGPIVSSSVGSFKQLSADDVEEIEAACAAGMEAMGYELITSPARSARATAARPSLPRQAVDRLRYYGLNRERWRRGMFRWRLTLRVRLRHAMTPASRRGG